MSSKEKYVIATIKSWNVNRARQFIENNPQWDVTLITDKDEFTAGRLRKIAPRRVFIPHWSWIIPEEIYAGFECVIFHMTDLPFGRGGSPLQNLIARGIYRTKISAIRCVGELDAGDVYLKRNLCLHGGAEEIFIRMSKTIFEDMIPCIIKEAPKPVPQNGEVTIFKRRKRRDGDLSNLDSLEKAFDYIRMLDAEGYPRAFLQTDALRFEYSRPRFRDGEIHADVTITPRREGQSS